MEVDHGIAGLAALMGDPARAAMLSALMGGQALTASELAQQAGVGAPTASAHLAKLEVGGLVSQRKQGRHRYFRLAGRDVAEALEALMALAARAGDGRRRPGPREPAMRRARVCYDHLAGEAGVRAFDSLVSRGLIVCDGERVSLTKDGEAFFEGQGVDVAALRRARRPLAKACLDWSERRSHLAGGLGAGLLSQLLARGWAERSPGGRALIFNDGGAQGFEALFPERAA